MDHHDDRSQRSVPQQDYYHQQQQQQQRTRRQPQQWANQRSPTHGYHPQQQQYRRPSSQQHQQQQQQYGQDIPIQQHEVDYRTQQPGASLTYAMHPSPNPGGYASSSGSASAYPPQHYQSQLAYRHHHHPAHHAPPPPPHHHAAPPPPHHHPHHHPQQLAMQQPPIHMQQHMMPPAMMAAADTAPPPPQPPYVQPTVGRLPNDRPLVKLSVSLIDTYKQINKVYYEEREARRAARAAQKAQKLRDTTSGGGGSNNNGWDDENYDYIVKSGEMFYGRYLIKERIGKGSFGQVVRAVDTEINRDVAIKIIKSRKPFLMQAKTEIELLTLLCEKDHDDQNNIVRLNTHFMYRNHQCIVFEMLSLNLYELLKNTQFGGVSLNLIRKFAKQILKALSFLARPDVDIIHCDLKPENILLRHPKRSGIKVIDFGSSCKSNKRMYSYIQSRFYRSPEVMLGMPYNVAIDMWSLGCILAEMHTGEPLFSGSDQFDQMQKIVRLLGMVPSHILDQASEAQRVQFFERIATPSGHEAWMIRQTNPSDSAASNSSGRSSRQRIMPSSNPMGSLTEVICSDANKKKRLSPGETGNTARNYELFVDLVYRMLSYDPKERIKPEEALNHAFIRAGDQPSTSPYPSERGRRGSVSDITEAATAAQQNFQLQNFVTGRSSSQRKREAVPSQRAAHR